MSNMQTVRELPSRKVPSRAVAEAVVRVLVCGENEVLRLGFATVIGTQDGFAVAHTGLSGPVLLCEAQARRHDVVLVELDRAACLHGLLSARSEGTLSDVAVVALVSHDETKVDDLNDLVLAGLDGVVSVHDNASQLSDALHSVRRGQRWLSPVLGGRLLSSLVGTGQACDTARNPRPPITCSERSVLELVAQGLTVAQIATRVHRSESAVKYHLANLAAKYQANNRAHLVYLAVRAGELPFR